MVSKRKKDDKSGWLLDQSRFLDSAELHRLRKITQKEKNNALEKDNRVPVKDWFLVCIATETGLRVKEISDLSCGDLHIDGNRSSVLVRNGKGGKKRIVRIRKDFRDQAIEFLKWKQGQGENIESDATLFCVNSKRMSKRAMQRSYERSLEKAGIKQAKGVGIHSLRHTYASFLLKASKFNLRLVQRQLGHESVKTTEIYAHVFDQDMEKALGRLYA